MNLPTKEIREGMKIINGDCMEVMKQYEDNYFDLAVVDPPYGIDADKKNSTTKKQSTKSATRSNDYGSQSWDSNVPTKEYFLELKRVSKHQIIWGINYYPYDFLNGGRIYWDKQVTMPTYSDGELALCTKINSIRSFTFGWHGMIQGDMKNKEQRIHPTQKPVKLYNWIYKNYAQEGQKILDTHLGSGSNAISAHYAKMGEFVGVELDEDYYKSACERIKKETMQLELF
jgi:site-specific DNA-methyltransferase (adenine-specific)